MVKRSRKTPRSRRLRSLRVSHSFRVFALDQLSSVDDLTAKPMFGGFGLYSGDTFFGILAADALYLKVDNSNRADYENVKAQPFTPFADGRTSMSYFAVPVNILESSHTLARWAERSISAARSSKKSSKRRLRQ
jgi:DNA transformation protein and related proteins